MLDIITHLDSGTLVLLCLALFLVLFFEFINGFHDTANAVATVIYTQAMKPWHAVSLSSFCNFLGVVMGGLAVAYAIVNLLPMDLIASGDHVQLMAMILSMLIGAIIWNLGTWYFGLPASSSHTLIGAIIGVGLTHALLTHESLTKGINWGKALDVGMSLLFSPLIGFIMAFAMLFFLKRFIPNSSIHQSPYLRTGALGKRRPPFWTRFFLILSSAAVSFAHGSNDGQKGIGLLMLALICVLPNQFVINTDAGRYELERAASASSQLASYYQANQTWIEKAYPYEVVSSSKQQLHCQVADTQKHAASLQGLIKAHPTVASMSSDNRWSVRHNLLCLETTTKKLANTPGLAPTEKKYLNEIKQDFAKTVEYAPLWVIIAVASALGLGTMIGWKRVARTIGEGIGKSHMTYSQGVCAQITTALGIAGANLFGLPVSTTQILSSAVAGTAVANKSGLKKATIRNIVLAWLFTFPTAMLLGGGLYYFICIFL